MKNISVESASRKAVTAENAANIPANALGGHTALDRRYGEIGISAVAAAARYQGAAKNPAYAPAPAAWWDRPDGAA
jgi:hypothetical protein